ncbi:hypothetical protein BJY04DRAFT_128866 [Aspergillus karnatakaensis]|uniref:uncharacterized protein n=1 Tax=Aspergillus karnatakaensis TaxID=1810916 RepID=UPI003CCE23D9
MECLGIPVDHRLVTIIKDLHLPLYAESSDHLNILKKWGESSTCGERPLERSRIHHGLELAKPGTTGGVLVALLQPYSKQAFDKGFVADLKDCATTDSVRDLIQTATGGRMDIDDVSVFDTLPYCADGTGDANTLLLAQNVFQEMVEAKKPDVVLSCYRVPADNRNAIVRELSSRGVGRVHDELEFVLRGGSTKRINAFHPSYAVNYHRTYSCFRRLLLVEFVQAFTHCLGAGIEESWIWELRQDCAKVVRNLSKEQTNYKQKRLAKPKIDEDQWKTIVNHLRESISKLGYFKESIGVDDLVHSNLTWICADASLFLTEVEKHSKVERNAARRVGESVKDDILCSWSQIFYADIDLKQNESLTDPRGFYEATSLLIEPEALRGNLSRDLHRHLHAFLLDLNLSFKCLENSRWQWKSAEHTNAFKRFAGNLERTAMRYSTPLSDGMRALEI